MLGWEARTVRRFATNGSLGTKRTEVCTRCERLSLNELPCSSEGEDRPSDNSNDGEWWPDEAGLDAVTIGTMSIDSKPVATDGERGRYRDITVDSGAGESVVNPDDWPNVDVKPSKRLSE